MAAVTEVAQWRGDTGLFRAAGPEAPRASARATTAQAGSGRSARSPQMKTRGDKAPPKERFSPSMEIEKPQSDRSKPASYTQPPPAAAATIRIKPPIADSNGLYSKLEATLARLKQNNEREATVGGWTIKVHGRTNQSAGGTHCCFIDPADSERITTLRRLREKLGGQVTAATPLAGHQGQHKRSRTASLAFFLNRKEPKEQQQQQQRRPRTPRPSRQRRRSASSPPSPRPHRRRSSRRARARRARRPTRAAPRRPRIYSPTCATCRRLYPSPIATAPN